MNNSKIFNGTIMRCTEHNDITDFDFGDTQIGHSTSKEEVYKEDATLVRTRNGLYVDVAGLSPLDIAYLYFENKKGVYYGEPFMFSGSHGGYEGELYVDEKSIKPYVPADATKSNTSLVKLKREVSRK